MISTKSEEFAEHLRLLRAHGWTRNLRRPPEPSPGLDPRYSFESWGFNVRPTELNAAFGLEQLKRFDILQRQRSKAAEYGLSRIKQWQDSMTPMKVAAETGCSWFAFPVMISKSAKFQRDDLVKYLELNGVETRPIVAGNLGRQPATKNLKGITVGDLPGADFIHDNGFYFGLHPLQEMEVEFERVWDLVDTFMRSTT